MMLGSLSFLHSSPPVFSSANTVYPSFLFLYLIFIKISNPSKSEGKIGVGHSERCTLDQLSFPTAFRVGSIPFFHDLYDYLSLV